MTKIPRNRDLRRLQAHRIEDKQKRIETFEQNKWVRGCVEGMHNLQQIPGCQGVTYNRSSYGITIRFIGMSVQWYIHTGICVVQQGNDAPSRYAIDAKSFINRLEKGRSAFIY